MIEHTERLIVVLGMAHSGTTILTHTLANHPDVTLATNGGEAWLLENDWLPNEDSPPLVQWLETNTGRRLLLKRPWNECLHAEWMSRTMPDARFIYCRREFSEIRKSWSKPTSFVESSLRNPTEQFAAYSDALVKAQRFADTVKHFFTVDHERLLANPARELARLTRWLDLPKFEFDVSAIGTSNLKHQLIPDIASGRYTLGTRGNGFTWAVDPHVVQSGLDLKDHEDWIYPFLETPRDGVFVDVGAFVGTHAIRVAKQCRCRVIAFEPVPAHVSLCYVNELLNEVAVEIIAEAVGDFAGVIGFRADGPAESGVPCDFNRINTSVPITTLDRALGTLERLDTLLIDVEGFEVRVLHGGCDVIRRCRPKIIVEVHSHYPGCEHNGNLIDDWCRANAYTSRRVWENSPSYFYLELLPCL